MGKRSTFERRERDFYPTPVEAVRPLLPHLPSRLRFAEPCCGDGALVGHIQGESENAVCVSAFDVEPRGFGYVNDAMRTVGRDFYDCDMIITNPPWDRSILHPMIQHFSAMRPTWLLFDADWVHTRQSAPFIPLLRKIVSVGRVKWIPDSKFTGKDNCAWHLFDANGEGPAEFYGRAA